MNTTKSSKKSLLVTVGIIIVALLALFYFMGGSGGSISTSLLSSQPIVVDQVGARVLSLLNQIESLKIDTSIFSGAAYQTLVDFSVTIPPQDVGRPNPFAPIPGVRTER